jgi:hypothetical protein
LSPVVGDVLAGTVAAAVVLAAAAVGVVPRLESGFGTPGPALAVVTASPLEGLEDARPVAVYATESWEKIPLQVTAEDLLEDPTLWNRMNFDDWDRLPDPLRTQGLERLVSRHGGVAAGEAAWEAMTAADWDGVPQPIRAMAVILLGDYWTAHYGLGIGHGIDPLVAADTLAALLMSESWFEHRAVNVDVNGNRDLGLPQLSDYARTVLERLHRRGWLDFHLREAGYFNPWFAVLAGAVWLDLMLDEADGDVELAVRAYRRGIAAARRGDGGPYLEKVEERRDRYIRGHGVSPTWDYLSRRLRGTRLLKAPAGGPRPARRR